MADTTSSTIIADVTADIVLKRREVIHLDVDAFEVQVWTNNKPWLATTPVVVINSWKKIVAVNYPARSYGIARSDKLSQAKEKCPELFTFEIPNRWGKPDQRKGRHSSYAIYDAIKEYFNNCGCEVEIDYASRDEMYMDISPLVDLKMKSGLEVKYDDFHHKTILEKEKPIFETAELESFLKEVEGEGISSDSAVEYKRFLIATMIAGDLLKYIQSTTGFKASAGVGVNKLQAKLACGHNKPNAVTAFMDPTLDNVSKKIKIGQINGLGGKKGEKIKQIFVAGENDEPVPVSTMYHLRSIAPDLLIAEFDEQFAIKIRNWAMGIDETPVVNKSCKASISVERKIFSGNRSLRINNENDLKEIIHNFSEEMSERLDEEKLRNRRYANSFKILLKRTSHEESRPIDSGTFSCPEVPDAKNIYKKAWELLEKNWELNGKPPLHDINKVQLLAKDFNLFEG